MQHPVLIKLPSLHCQILAALGQQTALAIQWEAATSKRLDCLEAEFGGKHRGQSWSPAMAPRARILDYPIDPIDPAPSAHVDGTAIPEHDQETCSEISPRLSSRLKTHS